MLLAGRLQIPDHTAALLWDMDGVLLDTLSFDYEICNRLLQAHAGPCRGVTRSRIREVFPYDLPEFWRRVVESAVGGGGEGGAGGDSREALVRRLVAAHEAERERAVFRLGAGVTAILAAAREQGIRLAVVSNNPTQQVRTLLGRHELLPFFDAVVGNDVGRLAKKPAPDTYLYAAKAVSAAPARCAVVEDSLLGAEAARRAGCFTVGVATGASTLEALQDSPFVDVAYSGFSENRVRLEAGHVTRKRIVTPNDFVSHMIEHVAWRLGCSIDLEWNNTDWAALGQSVGEAIARFERRRDSSAALGMIDDGSAEVTIAAASGQGGAVFERGGGVDLDWFLSLRCEQVRSGEPLVDLLNGIAAGLAMRIGVMICSARDPHHTWEGVFRSVGIALSRMIAPGPVAATVGGPAGPAECQSAAPAGPAGTAEPGGTEAKHWDVTRVSVASAEVIRRTAESVVRVRMDFSGYAPPACRFEVADSIRVDGLGHLLDELARPAGLRLEVDFKATRLSSSHVVAEDTGMVMGRALQEILVRRMRDWGVNGAGSNVSAPEDLASLPVRVGLSVEGRKFWTFVPIVSGGEAFRREFLVGHTVAGGLFSEDLDDFIDGFAGGLAGSIVVHVRRPLSPEEGWPLVFRGLGAAIAEAVAPNPHRRGVPPGVKATLA